MFNQFVRSESGAVTVDWVVLTAALVGTGLAVMSVVSSGVEDLSGDIKAELAKDHTQLPFGSIQPTSFEFSGYLWRAEADWGTRLDAQMDEYRNTDDYTDQNIEDILEDLTTDAEEAWANDDIWTTAGELDQAGRLIEVAKERNIDTTGFEQRYQTIYDAAVIQMDAHCTEQPGQCVL